ncbi:MAG: CsoS2 family carboxysome shell protein, partial [Cyanobium sp.]
MASSSSRAAALERRKALTSSGKKSAGRYGSTPGRVRTAADSRPSRTSQAAPSTADVRQQASSAAPEPRSRPSRATVSLSSPSAAPSRHSSARPIANPSRDLVLARREALSRRGKRADTSRDRTRQEVRRPTATGAGAPAVSADPGHKCRCQEGERKVERSRSSAPSLSLDGARASSHNGNGGSGRSTNRKVSAQHNPSRSLVLARREALSNRGKSAVAPTSSTAASVARQANPDLTTRELAQKVRELKCKVGSAGTARTGGGSRPTGPTRHGARQAAAADAAWK